MAVATLLLVDDDEMSSQILSYILVEEGYEVDMATTGASAIEKSAKKVYDLVLLDYILPDLKGQEVARRMKTQRPEMKIILLTGYTNEGNPTDPNYVRVMLKPVPPDVIVRTIADLLH